VQKQKNVKSLNKVLGSWFFRRNFAELFRHWCGSAENIDKYDNRYESSTRVTVNLIIRLCQFEQRWSGSGQMVRRCTCERQ